MNFVILDLEWNGTYSRRIKSFINEIIEFGAVKVDEQLHIIDTFEALVRAAGGEEDQRQDPTLTSITNEELAGGRNICRSSAGLKMDGRRDPHDLGNVRHPRLDRKLPLLLRQ